MTIRVKTVSNPFESVQILLPAARHLKNSFYCDKSVFW